MKCLGDLIGSAYPDNNGIHNGTCRGYVYHERDPYGFHFRIEHAESGNIHETEEIFDSYDEAKRSCLASLEKIRKGIDDYGIVRRLPDLPYF